MHLYPLLLFAIIVLSLLFLVMTGTGLYSAVVDSQTRNREARAALSYLAARAVSYTHLHGPDDRQVEPRPQECRLRNCPDPPP